MRQAKIYYEAILSEEMQELYLEIFIDRIKKITK
ncbi:hypothetical protein SAMN05192545_2544 [Maribacter dokdonensis]|uniref:Uncharacterized protein n=1 Tax=Maribacter dokdonensis TaxID=320912 RepID=A0A1H4NPC5_9FLAO|nr:hypothetical protein SAMN05192545_2544 [Maribacter dokdonensis]SEB96805.1 hypothetical protein SAMN05192540_2012 [Maribacter dokdonensis]